MVGSTNPVKVKATQQAFAKLFPQASLRVEGGKPLCLSVSVCVCLCLCRCLCLYVSHAGIAGLPVAAPSGVRDQPMGDAEALAGARNRCRNAALRCPGADYYVGLEGGCEMVAGTMTCFAWMVVHSAGGREGKAKTGTFDLPPAVAELVQGGMELGHANDQVFATKESKHGGGAVGLLTSGAVDRTAYYEQALLLALIPFHMPDLYT